MSESFADDRPNIVILGVGHSGTTVAANMFFALGWHGGARAEDVDADYAEHIDVRRCNTAALAAGALPAESTAVVAGLKAPWVVKDPRMVFTLSQWQPIFAAELRCLPTVVWIVKDLEAVRRSHAIRNEYVGDEPGSHGRTIDQLWTAAENEYARWSGPKVQVEFAGIAAAAAVFRTDRTPGGPDRLRQTLARVAALETSLAASDASLASTTEQWQRQSALLHEELAKFDRDGVAKREVIDGLKSQLRRREEQLARLQHELAEYVRGNGAQTETIHGLHESIRARDQRLADVETQLGQRTAQIERLQLELREFVQANAAQTQTIEDMNASVRWRDDRLAELQRQLAERDATLRDQTQR